MSSRPRSRITAVLVIVGSIASVATSYVAIEGQATLPALTLDAEHPAATVRVRAELRDARRVPNPTLSATVRLHGAGSGQVRARILRASNRQVLGEVTGEVGAEHLYVLAGIWPLCEAETTCVDEVLIEIALVEPTTPATRIEVDGSLEARVPHGQKGSIRLDVARDP